MVPEITDEAIEAFVSFTSASRERAIAFLQHNNGDSHRAINAYFENPDDPLPPVQEIIPSTFREYHSPTPQRSYDIDRIDIGGLSAPSRPPSRVGIREKKNNVESTTQTTNTPGNPNYSDDINTDGLTLAEREEHEMQHAITASLGHNLPSGDQESGVTAVEGAKFGPANREHYDTQLWALTLPSAISREMSIDPDPELRRRIHGTPRFLRPGIESDYFPAYLTILHSIPIAREELLWRDRVASDYGNDSQWWNGQPALTDLDPADAPWEDAVHEIQRLMAFLDRSQRAFGSADVLSNLSSLRCWRAEDRIATFLKLWEEISPPAEGELPQKTFYSRGVKQSLSEDECANEPFSLLDLSIDKTSGRTLYDLLDGHIWCDMPGKDLDDIWLEEVAPVFTMRVTNHDGNRLDLKIPAVWYPDRYMKHCKEFAVELRKRRVVVDVELEKLGAMVDRYLSKKGSISVDTIVQKVLAGSRVALTGPYQVDGAPSTTQEDVVDLIEKLRTLTEQITHKIQELEERKAQALESLRQLSNCFTGQASSAEEAPRHKYTLRGVCTEPHIFYVLKPRKPDLDLMTDDVPDVPAAEQWQWWRISFSVDDAKVGSAGSASLKPSSQTEPSAPGQSGGKPVSRATVADNVDIIGYTARPVREIEVLHAAKEESSSVVLVYANEEAMGFEAGDLPEPLKNFIDKDNELFEQELAEFTAEHEEKTNTTKEKEEDLLMDDVANDDGEEGGEKIEAKGQEMQERTGQHSASIMPPPAPPRQRAGAGGQGALMDQITEENEHDEDSMQVEVETNAAPAA
ncbi:ubiquitin interaction domain-containing protein [Nannizzia gypsea CBS 118893]|uniref:Ubiquitin interaction domain-containing protein n=1 Tax=Arthroderma gypseum (strain ATCC MYA-4604 / CBS 118893) TaxID=535722 RepID=E4USY2_ARTGP|nr:ubiquitin interaction domain-containing protein [Nannizzia gypsea CBS 118893]EFR01431.1 ubiquitin interaction domain-containing protein [Nannizzia gypsea CBS 118893]